MSGYLEGEEQPLTRAVTEIREELGLSTDQIELVRIGEKVRAYDEQNDTVWIINPFLFKSNSTVKLDWENTEYKWVLPLELVKFETVPKLREALDQVWYDLQTEPTSLAAVLRGVRELADDRVHGATFLGRRALELLSQAAQDSDAVDSDTLFFHLLLTASRMQRAQPAMANVWNLTGKLIHLVNEQRFRGVGVEELRSLTRELSVRILEDVDAAAEELARQFASILPQGEAVLTHSYSSAVFRALELGFKGGKRFKVYATESYPGMEGKQLAKDLVALGIPVTLIADSAVPTIIDSVSMLLVGADTVLADGSLVHKTGTKEIANAAKTHGKPFYSLCDTVKLSMQDFLGDHPRISTIFDVTPAEFVSAYTTEEGELSPEDGEDRIRGLKKEV